MITKKDIKFQLNQVKQLNDSKEYCNASIYTVLLDLVLDNDPDDITYILEEVNEDLDKYKEYLKNHK